MYSRSGFGFEQSNRIIIKQTQSSGNASKAENEIAFLILVAAYDIIYENMTVMCMDS